MMLNLLNTISIRSQFLFISQGFQIKFYSNINKGNTSFSKQVISSLQTAYVMHCTIWYQSLFGICMIVETNSNACYQVYLPSFGFCLFV